MGMGRGRVARVSTIDPDAERDVDLQSLWDRIAARWPLRSTRAPFAPMTKNGFSILMALSLVACGGASAESSETFALSASSSLSSARLRSRLSAGARASMTEMMMGFRYRSSAPNWS